EVERPPTAEVKQLRRFGGASSATASGRVILEGPAGCGHVSRSGRDRAPKRASIADRWMIGHRVSRDELAGRPLLMVERVAARRAEAGAGASGGLGDGAAAQDPAGIHVLGVGAVRS